MTKIDFYILADESNSQRYLFACRLVEKAYKLGHQVYIHSDNSEEVDSIDKLLWSFRETSFVPHTTEYSESEAQVLIGCGDGAHGHNDLMVNLSNKVPEFFSRFDRVSEIVVQEPLITASTRESYRFYRDRGYPLESHDLRGNV